MFFGAYCSPGDSFVGIPPEVFKSENTHSEASDEGSLIPRPFHLCGREKMPGIDCFLHAQLDNRFVASCYTLVFRCLCITFLTVASEWHYSSSLSIADSWFGDAVAYSHSVFASSSITLKEEQLLPVKALYKENDVFVWLSTGFGKSLCY